jgi:hypothetical protein
VAGGLFYKFRKDKRSMGLVYDISGIIDILPSTTGNQVNSAWQLTITIPSGAGKVNASNSNKNTGQ